MVHKTNNFFPNGAPYIGQILGQICSSFVKRLNFKNICNIIVLAYYCCCLQIVLFVTDICCCLQRQFKKKRQKLLLRYVRIRKLLFCPNSDHKPNPNYNSSSNPNLNPSSKSNPTDNFKNEKE